MAGFFHQNLSYFLSGISVGGQYALIAIGYTMVYGILRLINFAHGDVFMCAGLVMVYLSASLPFAVSVPLVLVFTVALGFLIERVAYKPLRSAPRMSVMISAIGVSYLLQNAALYFTGGLAKVYPEIPFLSRSVVIWDASTRVVTLVTPFLTVILVVLLTLLIKHTKIGMAMRAVSRDFETSQLMGIKINRVISITFMIGSFLAAVCISRTMRPSPRQAARCRVSRHSSQLSSEASDRYRVRLSGHSSSGSARTSSRAVPRSSASPAPDGPRSPMHSHSRSSSSSSS